jgi:hypothetical protein
MYQAHTFCKAHQNKRAFSTEGAAMYYAAIEMPDDHTKVYQCPVANHFHIRNQALRNAKKRRRKMQRRMGN